MSNCWNWGGNKGSRGYGQLYDPVLKRMDGAHRFYYRMLVGEIPAGKQINHDCDNPGCVNPKHLYLGTQSDNVQDALNRGRHRYKSPNLCGANGPSAKLTWDTVEEIRTRYAVGGVTQVQLAKEFGVTQPDIHEIVRRKSWK